MKNYLNLGSTIRACTALKTLSKIEPLLKEFGITRVANVTGLDTVGIPVAICIRPNAKHLSVSQGKGNTWELAKVSAIMESIEGYHAENPPAPTLFGSYSTLKTDHPVVDPELFHSGFLSYKAFNSVKLDWVGVMELNSNSSFFIPHTLISLDSSQCQPNYSLFSVTSNGLASGNNLDEAICHALYEVIERDALYHWYLMSFEEKESTKISISTIISDINTSLIKKLTTANLHVDIWDVTSKLNIPTYHCEIHDLEGNRALGEFTGSGTHLSKEVALARAITEAAQVRLTLITGSRDDVFPAFYRSRRDKRNAAESPTAKYSDGSFAFGPQTELNIKSSFRENIKTLLQSLKVGGFDQVFVMDHNAAYTDQAQFSVVHTFVPGLKYN